MACCRHVKAEHGICNGAEVARRLGFTKYKVYKYIHHVKMKVRLNSSFISKSSIFKDRLFYHITAILFNWLYA